MPIFLPLVSVGVSFDSASSLWVSLIWRREEYNWTGLLILRVNYTNMNCSCILNVINIKFGSHIYTKLIWLDKNIFHQGVETGLKDDFIKYYFLRRPWIVKIAICSCQLVLSTCHNLSQPVTKLLIAHPHIPSCFNSFIHNVVRWPNLLQ